MVEMVVMEVLENCGVAVVVVMTVVRVTIMVVV